MTTYNSEEVLSQLLYVECVPAFGRSELTSMERSAGNFHEISRRPGSLLTVLDDNSVAREEGAYNGT